MANLLLAYGASTAITCSLAPGGVGLVTNGARESTAITNTTNLFVDALVSVTVKLQTGTPASEKAVYIYTYGSEDGTNYTDNATGTDAAITLRTPSNLRLIGVIATPDLGALTYKGGPFSVAAAFGGLLPRKWGIVIRNMTNLTFDTTEANHTKTYTGVYYTV
jgi:hypothetical protein